MSLTPHQKRALALSTALDDQYFFTKALERTGPHQPPSSETLSSATMGQRDKFADWKELRPVEPDRFFSRQAIDSKAFLLIGFWGHSSLEKYQPQDHYAIEIELIAAARQCREESYGGILFDARGYPLTVKLEAVMAYWDLQGIDFGVINTPHEKISSPWLHKHLYPDKRALFEAVRWDTLTEPSMSFALRRSEKRYGNCTFLQLRDVKEVSFALIDQIEDFFQAGAKEKIILELDSFPDMDMMLFMVTRLQKLGHVVSGYTAKSKLRNTLRDADVWKFNAYLSRSAASRALKSLALEPSLPAPENGWTFLRPEWQAKYGFYEITPWNDELIEQFSASPRQLKNFQSDAKILTQEGKLLLDLSSAEASDDFMRALKALAENFEEKGREIVVVSLPEDFPAWRKVLGMHPVFTSNGVASKFLSDHIPLPPPRGGWQLLEKPVQHRTSSTVLLKLTKEDLCQIDWIRLRDELLHIASSDPLHMVITLSKRDVAGQRRQLRYLARKLSQAGVSPHFTSPYKNTRKSLEHFLKNEDGRVWSDPGEVLMATEHGIEPPDGDTYWKCLKLDIHERCSNLVVVSLKDINTCRAVFSVTGSESRKDRFCKEMHHLAESGVDLAFLIEPAFRSFVTSEMNELFMAMKNRMPPTSLSHLVCERSIHRSIPDNHFHMVHSSLESVHNLYI